jgi:hypothetical protein
MNAHEALELANASLLKNIEKLIEDSALNGEKMVSFKINKNEVLKVISHLKKFCYVVNTSPYSNTHVSVEVMWDEYSIAQKSQPYR